MTLFQAIIIGILSMLAASTPAMAGTTIGNYTLNRPLVAGYRLRRSSWMYLDRNAYASYVDCVGYSRWNRCI